MSTFAAGITIDDRIDRLVNLDFGDRSNEHLYEAARTFEGEPLVASAAKQLSLLGKGDLVPITTGSLSRAWVSGSICENDGPPGAAAVARALSLGPGAIPVLVAEESLLPAIGAVFRAAGLSELSLEQAGNLIQQGGRLSAFVPWPYPTTDETGKAAASELLDRLNPPLLLSTERAGRNRQGVYHSASGRDYGAGRSRVDYLFDEALARGIPTIGVGDGGNEIGMGNIADVVAATIPYGSQCTCGCGGGIAAVTMATVLVTAACSNWGCYGILASLAALIDDDRLLHTAAREKELLEAGMLAGLIDSTSGLVSTAVDGIPFESHASIVELIHELGLRSIKSHRAAPSGGETGEERVAT